jgi:hypothetical protein
MKIVGGCFLVILSLLHSGQASAQIGPPNPYLLKPGSSFETGCFALCLCPILTQPMQGTFTIRRREVGPLFTDYDVLDVHWTVPDANQNVVIVGSGSYRVGGEVGVQQQMTLDLSVGGGPIQHFDSGLILGGGTFPEIDIRVSLHQDQACRDTVLAVRAGPVAATSNDDQQSEVVPGIRAVAPNPFLDHANLLLSVAQGARVEVTVYDLQGRPVRHLAEDDWVLPGSHPISWDGTTDGGAACPAGVYFVRARIGGDSFVARVARLR